MDKEEGRHVLHNTRRSLPKWPFILAAAVVSALLLGYFALCGYVSGGGKILPNTTARGIPLGGLTMAEAGAKLRDAAHTAKWEADAIQFTCSGQTFAMSATGIGLQDANAVVEQAYQRGRDGGFLGGGGALLGALFGGHTIDAPPAFNADGMRFLNETLAQLGTLVENPVQESAWKIDGAALAIQKGTRGYSIDRAALERDLLTAFSEGADAPIAAEPVVTEPLPLDFHTIAAEIHAEPTDARLNPETFEILPSTVGVSLDIEAAQTLFDAAGEGARCTIELILTEPSVTTELLTAKLFSDVLGEYVSSVGGTSNRAANVNLAAQACNETILLPGDIFSYNNTTGNRSAAKGYLPAPAYVNGLSVDEIGGGICQVSSTIYAASLRANIKIVERANHMYAVGYVPDGQDATVYFGSLDYRFENNTPYPIKITAVMENRRLTVKLLGTRTDNLYVVMEGNTTSSTPYKTVYKPDPNIAPGTTHESITPYTGRRVEAYRCIYDNNGTPDDKSDDTLVSRTLESVNNYRHRDRVFLFNPDDAALYNVDPGTGQPIDPPPPPEETTPPVETTPPPVETTPPPVETTPPPVETTPPPVETTPPPVETTPPPVETTPAPVETTPAPVETTPAPVETTPAAVETTPATAEPSATQPENPTLPAVPTPAG